MRSAIIELHQRGLREPDIARKLGLAPTTVSYHLSRRPVTEPRLVRLAPDPPRAAHGTRSAVAHLLDEGHKQIEIARRLGISKSTVSYHARRLGKPVDDRYARRYDWGAIQQYYDAGHSVRECMKAYGFSSCAWSGAVRRGQVTARPSATPIQQLLVAETYRGRDNLKVRLIKEGLKDNRCERCGLSEWQGAPISVALHHLNGDRLDNRLDNLELLCPNCHSQTDTYSGRNGHRTRSGREPRPPR